MLAPIIVINTLTMIPLTQLPGRSLYIWKHHHHHHHHHHHLKAETLNRTLRRTHFGSGYGPVVRQTTEWMNREPNPISCFHPFEYKISAITYLISRTNTSTYPIYKDDKQREVETITAVSAQQAIYTPYRTDPSDIKSVTFTHLRNRSETLQFFMAQIPKLLRKQWTPANHTC
jgi:hypothetical protein